MAFCGASGGSDGRWPLQYPSVKITSQSFDLCSCNCLLKFGGGDGNLAKKLLMPEGGRMGGG